MAAGSLYPVFVRIPLYRTADDARAKRNIASYITPTGSEVEGPGKFYLNTEVSDVYRPAVPIWFIHDTYGGSGYAIGWVNDDENASPTVPQAPNGTMGSAMNIDTPRVHSGFSHVLKYKFGEASGNIATGVGETVNWTPPLTLANQVPKSTQGILTIICETYADASHTKLIGSRSINVYLYVPTTILPTISSVTREEAVSGLASQFLGFVRYKSKIRIRTTASGNYGATITSIEAGVDNQKMTGADVTTPQPLQSAAGSYPQGLYVKVTDSRGRSRTNWYAYALFDWHSPTINGFSAIRTNASGTPTDNGWNAKIAYSYTIASVNSRNTSKWEIHYSEDGITWSLSSQGTGLSNNTTTISGAFFNPDKSYLLRLTVTDFFGSVVSIFELPTSASVLDFRYNKQGLAVGKASEMDGFEIGWASFFREPVSFLGGMVVNEIALTLSNATGGTGADAPKAYKIGNLIFVEGFVRPTSSGMVLVATLPVGYRPRANVQRQGTNIDTQAAYQFWINTSGQIYLRATASARQSIGCAFIGA